MTLEVARQIVKATDEMTGVEIALATIIQHLEERIQTLEAEAVRK